MSDPDRKLKRDLRRLREDTRDRLKQYRDGLHFTPASIERRIKSERAAFSRRMSGRRVRIRTLDGHIWTNLGLLPPRPKKRTRNTSRSGK